MDKSIKAAAPVPLLDRVRQELAALHGLQEKIQAQADGIANQIYALEKILDPAQDALPPATPPHVNPAQESPNEPST